jgi:hypothetical protein
VKAPLAASDTIGAQHDISQELEFVIFLIMVSRETKILMQDLSI